MKKVIAWWSGGVTSAVACWLSIRLFGLNNIRVIFIDTKNEDADTYRFKDDCSKWYGLPIETMRNEKYESIQDVWIKYKSLNVANGAICSSELKRKVRLDFEKNNVFDYQVFGFDINEPKRAKAMTLNYPAAKSIYPLLLFGYDKSRCISILTDAGIEIPKAYKLGFNNNNCLNTGCVQGGIGYWQKMKRDFPDKFEKMAEMEHHLTKLKGHPVTMLKDQKNEQLIFLKPHPEYPLHKDISMMKGREPNPLTDCNGYCGINDLEPQSETEQEINYGLFTDFNN